MKREGDYIKHPPPTLYNVESFSFVNILLPCVFSVSYSLSLSLSYTHTQFISIPLHKNHTQFFTWTILFSDRITNLSLFQSPMEHSNLLLISILITLDQTSCACDHFHKQCSRYSFPSCIIFSVVWVYFTMSFASSKHSN